MPSSRNVVFLTLAAGVGVFVFLFARLSVTSPSLASSGGTDGPEGRTTAVGPDPVERDEPADLVDPSSRRGAAVAPGRESTVIHPLEVELSLALSRSIEIPDGAEPIKSGANARIEGSLRGTSGKPLPVTVTFMHGPNEGRVLQGDSEGRFGAGDLWPGLSIVKLESASRLTAVREVRLAQLRTTPIHVSFARASYLSGKVTDHRGAALEGAEVRVDDRVAYSDDEGLFTFPRVAPGTVFATVRKEGFAIARRKVGLSHGRTVLPEQFVIRMQRGATLEITVGRRAGDEDSTAAILLPATSGPPSGEAFPWYEVNPVQIPKGGRVTVEGLPAKPLLVRAFRRGAVQSARSVQARLQPGQSDTVKLDFDPAPLIMGVVLDGGEPVRGAQVTLEAANQSVAAARGLRQKNPRFSQDLVVPRVASARDTTRSDAKGRFQFTRDPELVTTYYVSATDRSGTRSGAAVVPKGDQVFTLELSGGEDELGELGIDLPGRFQGLPVEVSVQGQPRDPRVLGPGESLSVDKLSPGAWILRARWRGKDVVPRRVVDIEPGGTSEVEGRLPRAAIEGQSEEERRIHEMRTGAGAGAGR